MEKNAERTRYKCTGCKFEFSRKKGQSVDHCPYCGKKGSIDLMKGDFASKMLDEVSSLERLYPEK